MLKGRINTQINNTYIELEVEETNDYALRSTMSSVLEWIEEQKKKITKEEPRVQPISTDEDVPF